MLGAKDSTKIRFQFKEDFIKAEHNDGMKVSNLYIAQIKQKHGIIERENYNKPKSEKGGQPECPKDFLVICKFKAKEV